MKLIATGNTGGDQAKEIDWPAVRRTILGKLTLDREFAELGVSFVENQPDSKGWRKCWAVGREETEASAGVHCQRGLYHDFGTNETLDLFNAALKWHPTRWARWIDAFKHFADKARVDIGRVQTGKGGRIREAVYLYHQEDGSVGYGVFRYRLPNGEKTFSQHPPDGKHGAWKYGPGCMEGVEPLPYRLPELLAADPDDPVFCLEGEKDCDLAASLGLVATTAHGGTGNTDRTWPKFAHYLSGRDCVVIPDNDDAGRTHAWKVAGYLFGIARSVKVVELPDQPKKGDLSDWFDGGGDLDELGRLTFATAPVDSNSRQPHIQNPQKGQKSDDELSSEPSNGAFEGSECGVAYRNSSGWTAPKLHPEDECYPFPLDVLPYRVAELCREAAISFQCPVDYFAAPSLVLAGGVIGRSVALAINHQWIESPNLYLATVGAPGTRKSPAYRLMARPLYDIDRELRKKYADEKADGTDGDGEPPTMGHLTIDDTTVEAMGLVHSENPRGLVVILDELSAWVASLNQYRGGKGSDKQFWLKANSGSLVKVTRKGSRESIIIPRPCVALTGGLTPGMLPGIREGKTDDGWLDRILFAYPKLVESRGWLEHDIEEDLVNDWNQTIRRLWDVQPIQEEHGEGIRPRLIHFTEAARGVWIEWYNAHHAEQQTPDFLASLRGPWSKLEGFCARLALILSMMHQASDPAQERVIPADVDELAIWGATRLIDYFKSHFRRARFELTRKREIPEHVGAMLTWFRHRTEPQFSRRDARQNFKGRFAKDPEALEETLRWLVGHHCIKALPEPREKAANRPRSGDFLINPELLYGGQDSHSDPDSEDE